MRKHLSTIILCLIAAVISVVLLIVANTAQSTAVTIIHLPIKYGSVVRLTQDGSTFCTGTVIGPHTVLTAAHCVLDENPYAPATHKKDIEIRPSSNQDLKIGARVVSIRHQLDQAVLEGDFHKFNVRPIITDPEQLAILRKTSKLTACGYPMGGELYCNAVYYRRPDNFFWAVEGVLIPGMSGGCVVDENGNVVATNVAVQDMYSIVAPTYNLRFERGN